MGPKKILIVDDETDMVDILQARLEASGYQILTAVNGEDGLQKARRERPDLVILDIMMPHLNGYQVCREIKRDPEMRPMKVLILTAKAQESDRFWGMETGADEFITKPYDTAVLLERIRVLLPA